MKKLAMLVLVTVIAGFASVSIAKAQDPNTPKAEPKIRGKVVVVKDADGIIAAVQLESKRFGTYNVVLDAKGKELGETQEGKLVSVKAAKSTKDEQEWLTVESYSVIQMPKGKDSNKGACEKDSNKGAREKGCKNKK